MDAMHTIQRIGRGTFIDDLHEALIMVSEECIAVGKKGKVTVNLVIEPVKGEPQVIIAEEINKAPPKKDPKGAILFELDGEFHNRDPRQPELELREVETDEPEARSLDSGTEASNS